MRSLLPAALLLALSGCTAGQVYATAQNVGQDAQAFYNEHVEERRQLRDMRRRTVRAEYDALMRRADAAERDSDMVTAAHHWAAARALIEANMPRLRTIRCQIQALTADDACEVEQLPPLPPQPE